MIQVYRIDDDVNIVENTSESVDRLIFGSFALKIEYIDCDTVLHASIKQGERIVSIIFAKDSSSITRMVVVTETQNIVVTYKYATVSSGVQVINWTVDID